MPVPAAQTSCDKGIPEIDIGDLESVSTRDGAHNIASPSQDIIEDITRPRAFSWSRTQSTLVSLRNVAIASIAEDAANKLAPDGNDASDLDSIISKGSSPRLHMLRGLGVFLEVMTTPRAGTVYTFISMTATIVLGIVAWKLSQESLDVSLLAHGQNANPARTASQAPSGPLPAVGRSLEAHIHGRRVLGSSGRGHAISSLYVDILYVLAIIVLFLSNHFLEFMFRARKGPITHVASFINFLMSPAMLIRLSRDAPRFYASITIFAPFIYAPLIWHLLFTAIARFKTTPVNRPIPNILMRLKDIAVRVCRVTFVALCLYSAYNFAVGQGSDSGITLMGITIKTFVLILVAEIQLERGDITNRILPKEPVPSPV